LKWPPKAANEGSGVPSFSRKENDGRTIRPEEILKEIFVKVDVNELSGCSKEVHVEVPADAVQTKVDIIYRRISSEAKVPGFRKGKVPLEILKKEYKTLVREEMVRNELPEFFRSVLIERKIHPVAQPQITHLQFEEGSAMKFVGLVETKPEFKLKDYKGLKVKKEAAKVKEDEVDRLLDGLREQKAQFIPVEDRAAKENDLLIIDFIGKIGGKPFEGGKAERYPVLLGSQGLLKDFETNLMGMSKGSTKTFQMTFPADYSKKEVAGQEAEFTVTVQELKEKKLPMVDNDLAKEIAQVETVKDLREKLEAQIKSQKELEQRGKMVEQIGEKLIADNPFDVPASLVSAELQRLVNQGVDNLRRQGMDVKALTDDQKREFIDKLRPLAEKNVRMALMVEKIAETEGVKCEPKDLEAYYEKVAQGSNQPVEAVKAYLSQGGRLESTQEWIQYEKTLDLLISLAKVESA